MKEFLSIIPYNWEPYILTKKLDLVMELIALFVIIEPALWLTHRFDSLLRNSEMELSSQSGIYITIEFFFDLKKVENIQRLLKPFKY